ncbi:chemotaxis protein CheD [Pueribacillus sp. YX66]|uniref:chemotaxis protein CheD n=1 Tax=Pueribacillus sp. YX66 TaxID=3229242 RepID=UPI00358D5EBC
MNRAVQIIKVGLAEIKTARPPHILRTSGLGSCVGVVVYNEKLHLAAMAHVMLPDSSLARDKPFREGKYANTAVQTLHEMLTHHDVLGRLKAKIAGGSQMFQFQSDNELMRIGKRNIDAVKDHLLKFNIQLVAEDVGGNTGRTIEFNPETFMLSVRKVNAGTIEI